MKTKYRQAVANLAKQAHIQKNNPVDPLTTICAQMRKTKLINKEKLMPSLARSMFPQKNSVEGSKKQPNAQKNMLKNRTNAETGLTTHPEWVRFLPQACDEFECNSDEENQSGQKVNLSNIQSSQKEDLTKITYEEEELKPQTETFNIQEFKSKLGFGAQAEKPKVEQKKDQKIEAPQEEKVKVLPFEGRPFEQAPPRPAPKKIHEYPPTCKVAGIYQWPPPKSEYRQWKAQMKESRKLK